MDTFTIREDMLRIVYAMLRNAQSKCGNSSDLIDQVERHLESSDRRAAIHGRASILDAFKLLWRLAPSCGDCTSHLAA